MANGPAAFYLAGSVDGSRPGIFYVNTFKFSSQPKYEMISLSMHEAEFNTGTGEIPDQAAHYKIDSMHRNRT